MKSEDLGLPFDRERIEYLTAKYQPILNEIRKLRQIDLKETYPAVFFDPTVAYRTDTESRK